MSHPKTAYILGQQAALHMFQKEARVPGALTHALAGGALGAGGGALLAGEEDRGKGALIGALLGGGLGGLGPRALESVLAGEGAMIDGLTRGPLTTGVGGMIGAGVGGSIGQTYAKDRKRNVRLGARIGRLLTVD